MLPENPAPCSTAKTSTTSTMDRANRSERVTRKLWRMAFAFAMVFGILGLARIEQGGGIAAAQQRGPVMRSVTGKVIDKGGAALKGAVVYLKDDHTLAVKSFIVDDAGSYRFGQLSQSTDYELWAELDGKKSNTRTISSFDNKNEFVIDLKLDTGK